MSNKKYREAHPDRARKYDKEYAKRHHKKLLADKKTYREKYPERVRQYNLNSILRKLGISQSEYNELFAKQDGRCAICGRHQSDMKRRLAVDHDHKTGKVRGLLCVNCNQGLGQFMDNPELLIFAAKYLVG